MGWWSEVPENQRQFKSLPISNKPFEIQLRKGAIASLTVSKDLPTWEVNILKSIATQFQVDVQGKNAMKQYKDYKNLPKLDLQQTLFKTMEDTINGECETLYDISPLPGWVMQNRPQLVPMPNIKGNGQIFDIVKTKNFSNCDQRIGYHFGLNGLTDWKEASENKLGTFLAVSELSPFSHVQTLTLLPILARFRCSRRAHRFSGQERHPVLRDHR